MTTIECPLCDRHAELDLRAGTLDCAACGVRLELAPDPTPGLEAAA
jgi:hypothetical protein